MIQFAGDSDLSALKRIWKQGFGDSDDTIASFFDGAKGLYRCLCYLDGETPIATMYIFECDFCIDGKKHKCAYLYALSTLPEYRGRGIMGDLLSYACEKLKTYGYEYVALAPAKQSLISYYERFGFLPSCMAKTADIPCDSIFDFATETEYLTPDRLAQMRDSRGGSFVSFSSEYVRFALDFCDAAAISFDGGYAVCVPDDNLTRVIEYDGEINRVLSAVKYKFESESYRVFMPFNSLLGEPVCRGMIKSLCGADIQQNAHIGLIMD